MRRSSLLRITAITGTLICLAVLAIAQDNARPPAKVDPAEVAIKDTPAAQSLSKLAAEQKADSANINTVFQQARAGLDQSAKSLNEEVQKAQKDLQDKLKEDKHYKPLLDHIADVQKQLQALNGKATTDYQKVVGPVQQKLNTELADIHALIPVVRKENNLPDDASFDMNTGKWTLPAKK